MDHAHVFYKSRTMILLLTKGLVLMFPYIARKLDIRSYGVIFSCIGYTKQLMFSLYPYSGSLGMLGSSNPRSTPLLFDLSVDTSSLLVVRPPTEPLPEFGTSVVFMDISNVVTMNSQISACVACHSLHISTYLLGI